MTMKIVLSPIDSPYHTDDSVPIQADCGCQAWIGPTSLNMVLNPIMKTETVCMRHVDRKVIIEGFQGKGMNALPGIREEMEAALGKDEADQIWKRFNVTEWDGKLE